MKISVKEIAFVEKNYRTLAPLHWILNIVGLAYNLTSTKSFNFCWTITKNILRASILAAIGCFTLNYKINYLYEAISSSPSVKYTDTIQVVYDFTQYIVDLYFVHKYGAALSFEYFKQYGTIDQILGAVNYSRIRRNILRLMVTFAFLWTFSTLFDFGAWVLTFGWQESATYSLAYIFFLIKILTSLDLSSQAMHIECRLHVVGNLMESYCSTTEYCSTLLKTNALKKKWLDYNTTDAWTETSSKTFGRLPCKEYHDIKWLNRCYLLLIEQIVFINKLYGIRITLNILSLLIDMARFTNVAARIVIGSQPLYYSYEYLPIISNIMRMLTYAAVLVSLMWHCEQVYRQRDRILHIIDHLLVFKNPSEDLKFKAVELRDLIQSRPVDFNMANLLRLDYSLLISIASVFVTYSIILIQSIN